VRQQQQQAKARKGKGRQGAARNRAEEGDTRAHADAIAKRRGLPSLLLWPRVLQAEKEGGQVEQRPLQLRARRALLPTLLVQGTPASEGRTYGGTRLPSA